MKVIHSIARRAEATRSGVAEFDIRAVRSRASSSGVELGGCRVLTSWVAGGNLRECRRPEPLLIGMRFDSSEIGNSLTEIVAYGSAVVVEPDV